jgi:RimJ/RimL family protein N-acetyltransferase
LDPQVPLTIETARLTLTAPAPDDAVRLQLAILESLDELRPWIPWAQELPSLEILRLKAEEARGKMDRREYFGWRICLKETDLIIGSIDLFRWDWNIPKCEIGYWGRTPQTGRGYVTEAVKAVMAVACESFGARRIEALCDRRNLPSQRLLDRVGFTREAVLIDHEPDVQGELCDQVLYAWHPDESVER